MKTRYWILSGLLAGGLVLGGTALAMPHQRCDGHGPGAAMMGGGMHGGMLGPHRIMRLMDRLDLSDAQRDQIWDIVDGRRKALRTHLRALRDGRQALREAERATDFDATKVRALAEAQGQAMAELMVMKAETLHQVRQVLTVTQQQELQRLQARRGAPGWGRWAK